MTKKYIDAEKLIAEIERRIEETKSMKPSFDQFWAGQISAFKGAIKIAESLQQEQPKDKQIIIITESHGDANIEWDCRSLDDVIALLKSAESFIADKQIEELRGQGSGPDYNTTEGRFRNVHKFQQEQPELELEIERIVKNEEKFMKFQVRHQLIGYVARYFAEWGAIHLNARKKEI